jgi:UDP-N-acetylmuramoyl-L-alanyl-D-glutamate--2,6-diaminopimelate ligase
MSMMLHQLLDEPGLSEVLIQGLSDDSRTTQTGDLFCAINGEQVDGRDYIDLAVRNGACAVLAEETGSGAISTSVPIVLIENLGEKLGEYASQFFGCPSEKVDVVAVTGTNGKTSFVHLLSQALTATGIQCGLVGTLGYGTPGRLVDPGLTTPPPVALQRTLSHLVESGCQAIVLEASSHGIVQHRLNGTLIDIAVLTNITHDHLDYHGSMAAYQSAKGKLFQVPSLSNAVVNLDDEYAAQLCSSLRDDVRLTGFSLTDVAAEVFLSKLKATRSGFSAVIVVPSGQVQCEVPLFGTFNVQNLLAVIATLVAMGRDRDQIQSAMSSLTPVLGRMEIIREPGKPAIFIDYAHTPDALEKCLLAVREHFEEADVSCVFGCGGDRDKSKRAPMGEVASRLADRITLTSDNPRNEDPETIILDINRGVSITELTIQSDRRLAILAAIAAAKPDEVVVVAGKGHEDYQLLATGKVPFDDRTIVKEALDTYGKEH